MGVGTYKLRKKTKLKQRRNKMVEALVLISLLFGGIEIASWFDEPTVKEIRCNEKLTYCREYIVKVSEALEIKK